MESQLPVAFGVVGTLMQLRLCLPHVSCSHLPAFQATHGQALLVPGLGQGLLYLGHVSLVPLGLSTVIPASPEADSPAGQREDEVVDQRLQAWCCSWGHLSQLRQPPSPLGCGGRRISFTYSDGGNVTPKLQESLGSRVRVL